MQGFDTFQADIASSKLRELKQKLAYPGAVMGLGVHTTNHCSTPEC